MELSSLEGGLDTLLPITGFLDSFFDQSFSVAFFSKSMRASCASWLSFSLTLTAVSIVRRYDVPTL